MKWALAIFVLVTGACSDPAGTQYLPIGSRCGTSAQCGTSPYVCNASSIYPNGYCEKACKTDGDCPADALCNPTVQACRRKCKVATDCRADEGYGCFVVTGQNAVCEPSPSVDGGS
ncbi:MAG: hypothetical protein JWN44_3966 [Myxococcales bacterium]|nr:hypothetical protein [Myxococcales bacterium]